MTKYRQYVQNNYTKTKEAQVIRTNLQKKLREVILNLTKVIKNYQKIIKVSKWKENRN